MTAPAAPRTLDPVRDATLLAVMRAERARRAGLRDGVLRDVPRPGAALSAGGPFRRDRWPARVPPPDLGDGPPGAGGVPTRWTGEAVVDRVRTFAAARGADFSLREFLAWSGVGSRTVYDRCGSWPALRAAAGLAAARDTRPADVLHKLLCAYGLFVEHRRRRPTARELASAAGVGVGAVGRRGGVAALRDLHREWTDEAAWARDAGSP